LTKKKRNLMENSSISYEDSPAMTISSDGRTFDYLNETLKEIRDIEGIQGYIIRNSTNATIDLKDSTQISQQALLASQLVDFSQTITSLFGLGDAESVIVETKLSKMLCLLVGDNRLDVFMDKDVDHAPIIRKLSS
jgi:hypothetical protein